MKKKQAQYKMPPSVRAKIDAMTYEQRVAKAAGIILMSDGKTDQASTMHYLTNICGLTMTEYLEALNKATNGGLVSAALGDDN